MRFNQKNSQIPTMKKKKKKMKMSLTRSHLLFSSATLNQMVLNSLKEPPAILTLKKLTRKLNNARTMIEEK